MAKPDDLTAYASAGYAAPASANPHLWSSATHIAFRLGQWFHETGRPAPRDVRMSRGLSIRANDMLIRWNAETGACERIN
ncbi:hypothetical protein HAP47_0022740 [Bradyrhizobium sp. 41S5]|uniref:hypothetical protein n=1 Tax=Bradyrhizobium sp. 41S5 TaxID=1404443 RepID=UPI00156BD81D|nr:hypothetical protein [Bradyrhizobium sp. 41S5]UFX42081.1 hypothetical protein HAP47_0022740 [Bradyrhizobium sp. 41S5]